MRARGVVVLGPKSQPAQGEADAVTWDLAIVWFVLPAFVALVLGVGGIWLARRS